MDKSCQICALDGILAYRNTCKDCVESGTFARWTARTCQNCAYRFLTADVEPCKTCFMDRSFPTTYTMWKAEPIDTDLKAKDEPKGDTLISERMCVTCEHSEVGKDDEPCKTCIDSGNERSMWEPESKPESNSIHPAHYTECSLECIDVMLAVFGRRAVTDFCIINAFKYMWRYKHKNGLEDLQKAERYLAMATDFQMADAEQENRIINMKAELEILMRRVDE